MTRIVAHPSPVASNDRGDEYWDMLPKYARGRVFLLAGGPSLTLDIVRRLRGHRVIVINSSMALARQAGLDDQVLFFIDDTWFIDHEIEALAWRGPIVTLSRGPKARYPDRIRRVRYSDEQPFPRNGSIKSGDSAGQCAVGLAAAMGNDTIVLLGYDMKLVNGRSHHHDDYVSTEATLERFRRAFNGWYQASIEAGITIVNATSGSALSEFPRVTLDDELSHC